MRQWRMIKMIKFQRINLPIWNCNCTCNSSEPDILNFNNEGDLLEWLDSIIVGNIVIVDGCVMRDGRITLGWVY